MSSSHQEVLNDLNKCFVAGGENAEPQAWTIKTSHTLQHRLETADKLNQD